MLEEEEDSGTGMSGLSNNEYADDEFASCCSDCDISEDGDDVSGGHAGKMAEFMVSGQLAAVKNTQSATQIQQGIQERKRGRQQDSDQLNKKEKDLEEKEREPESRQLPVGKFWDGVHVRDSE